MHFRVQWLDMLEFVDTHCHIQDAGIIDDTELIAKKWAQIEVGSNELVEAAVNDGVTRLVCVGTTLADSQRAVKLSQLNQHCYASIGIHPHEAKDYVDSTEQLQKFSDLVTEDRVVAVGECGLDYYYNHSPKEAQQRMLRKQIELALTNNKPLIFHVREAFDDFWPIFDSYKGIRGVIHSFSASKQELGQILSRGLYVGLNGIMTFTRDDIQIAAAKAIPIEKLVLETDAPFLTPVPFRGKICQPKHVVNVAEFLADLRGESLKMMAEITTTNARKLFGI